MKGIVTIVLVLLALSVFAGDNKWTSRGPYGGTIKQFGFHPELDNLIFAVGNGLFRSRNAGLSWERLNLAGIFTVKGHPRNPGTLIAAGYSVFSSTNQGTSWEEIARISWGNQWDSFYDFEFDPTDPQILYVVSYYNGVYKSTDGGKTWSNKSKGLNLKTFVHCCDIPQIEIDPSKPATLYVLLPSRMAFRTTNGGESWQSISKGLTLKEEEHVLEIDPDNPDVLYAGGWDGIFKSTNRGSQWFKLDCPCGSRTFAIDPKDSSVLYSVGGAVRKSSDSGLTWKELTVDPNEKWSVGVHPGKDLVLIGGFGQGIFRSQNGGNSWRTVNNGIDDQSILKIRARSGQSTHFFASTGKLLYESRTAGANWELSTISKGQSLFGFVRDIQVHPQNQDLIAVAGGGGGAMFSMSTDAGRSWEHKTGMANTWSELVAADPKDEKTFYLYVLEAGSNTSRGIVKSTDTGDTWKLMNRGLIDKNINALAVDPRNASTVYVGTQSGKVFKSENGGSIWKSRSSGLNGGTVLCVTIDPLNSGVVYASTDRQTPDEAFIYKTTDGGRRWVLKNKGLPTIFGFHSIAVNPSNSKVLFAAGERGIFISTDAAENWSTFDPNGLGLLSVNDFLFDPGDSDTFHIGTGRGVFSYTVKASSQGPRIDQMIPAAGKAGDKITINGKNFGPVQQGSSFVLFGSLNAGTAESWSDTAIRVQAPSGVRTGAVTVTVAGRKSNPFEFIALPASGNLEPTSGPAAGGTRVTILAPSGISGTQFNVLFGSNLARDIRFTAPNIITCTTPPGNGTVDVSVTSSAVVAKVGTFTYQ